MLIGFTHADHPSMACCTGAQHGNGLGCMGLPSCRSLARQQPTTLTVVVDRPKPGPNPALSWAPAHLTGSFSTLKNFFLCYCSTLSCWLHRLHLPPCLLPHRLVTVPAAGQTHSQSCAPPSTAFATTGSLKVRVLVLQAHWQLQDALVDQAVTLPGLNLKLGSQAAASTTAGAASSSAAGTPALLGTFVGSGIYPPSRLSGGLQAFQLPAPADSSDGSSTATASLACSKRCTYVPLGKLSPKPVTVVGYSFSTFDRATNVSFEIQRGKWGRSDGKVLVTAAPGQGVVQLQQPFKVSR